MINDVSDHAIEYNLEGQMTAEHAHTHRPGMTRVGVVGKKLAPGETIFKTNSKNRKLPYQ